MPSQLEKNPELATPELNKPPKNALAEGFNASSPQLAGDEFLDEGDNALKPSTAQKTTMQTAKKPLLARYEAFLIPVLVCFVLGNAFSFGIPQFPLRNLMLSIPLSLLCAGVAVASVWVSKSRRTFRMACCLIALMVGAVTFGWKAQSIPKTDVVYLAPIQNADVMGVVQTRPANHRLTLALQTVNGKPATGKVWAYLPYGTGSEDIVPGTRVLMTGNLERPFHSPVPGSFNQQNYLNGLGVSALLRHTERLVAFETANDWPYELQRTTDALTDRIYKTYQHVLPSPQAEIFGGVVLGDKAIPVDKATKLSFVQTGLVHILAASGMNVGIIAASVFWLLSLLKVSYRKRVVVSMVAVALYSVMTGMPPSIQRAAVMLEFALLLKFFNRSLSPLFLLCLATGALVAYNPLLVGNVGFQFSVLTTFGILSMVPPLENAIGYYITRWLAALIVIPAAAQLWIWPLSLAYFNQFPIHSIPLNMVAMVLVTPLTVLGFASALFSLIFPPAAELVTIIARPFLEALLALTHWGSGLSWAQWSLASPSGGQIVLFYAFLFLSLRLLYPRSASEQKPNPTRNALIALVPLALLLGGMLYDQLAARNESQVSILPLSQDANHPGREVYLVKPAGTSSQIAILPSELNFQESHMLADYFRNQHIDGLSAVLMLPGTTTGSNRITQAFEKTAIDTLIKPESLSVSNLLQPENTHSFPGQGMRISLGDKTAIDGQNGAWRVMDGQRCLLGIQQMDAAPIMATDADSSPFKHHRRRITWEMRHNKPLPPPPIVLGEAQPIPGCNLQVQGVAPDERLQNTSPWLSSTHFYRLVQDDSRLSVFDKE